MKIPSMKEALHYLMVGGVFSLAILLIAFIVGLVPALTPFVTTGLASITTVGANPIVALYVAVTLIVIGAVIKIVVPKFAK